MVMWILSLMEMYRGQSTPPVQPSVVDIVEDTSPGQDGIGKSEDMVLNH